MNTRELSLINSDKVTLLDEDDYNRFRGFNWHLKDDGYVICDSSKPRRREGVSVKLKLHRLVTGCAEGLDVDHINGDRLDNRKENLRICTRSENLMNQAGPRNFYKGVYFRSKLSRRPWVAVIHIPNTKKNKYIGSFVTPEEAHEAYKNECEILHKEYSFYKRGCNENK